MKIIISIFLLLTFLSAKKDFFYSFINESGAQISERSKNEIQDGYEVVNQIMRLAQQGKVDEAYAQIKSLREQNRLKVLDSDILLTYAQVSLRKGSKRIITDASNELETAINSGMIHEEDLAQAYMIMSELKLNSNRVNDARYFAQIVVDNYGDEITNAYGKISLAKVHKHTSSYTKAISTLYSILVDTTDVTVATIVADELFDVYLLDGQREKAYELISKVLDRNMDYYSIDAYRALTKVDKLVNANMPEFAVEILQELLTRATQDEFVEEFKFKLANVYMNMYDGTNYFLFKAKELYKDILSDYPNGLYVREAKMFIDEILMREGNITPELISSKYPNSEAMQQKALFQEAINFKNEQRYEFLLDSKRVYSKVANSIAKRFGYETIEVFFDEVNILLIKDYLVKDQCFLLNTALKTSRTETLEELLKDEDIKFKFFECLIEVPYERGYLLLKETFNSSRDAELYLYLLRMAYSLGLYEDAMDFSTKVEMVNDMDVLKKEFLHRYLVYKTLNDAIAMEKFFLYASRFPDYIEANIDNPMIIDFYYDFYLYLISKDQEDMAAEILNKLYEKQQEIKAFIYSPFIELELAMKEKLANRNDEAIKLLTDALDNARFIKPNDLARVYYELIRLYDMQGLTALQNEFVLKCKEVEGTNESLYKEMCDKM